MKYFYSGNTTMINGNNTQSWGVITVDGEHDPGEIATQIANDKTKELGRMFVLTAFNRVDS